MMLPSTTTGGGPSPLPPDAPLTPLPPIPKLGRPVVSFPEGADGEPSPPPSGCVQAARAMPATQSSAPGARVDVMHMLMDSLVCAPYPAQADRWQCELGASNGPPYQSILEHARGRLDVSRRIAAGCEGAARSAQLCICTSGTRTLRRAIGGVAHVRTRTICAESSAPHASTQFEMSIDAIAPVPRHATREVPVTIPEPRSPTTTAYRAAPPTRREHESASRLSRQREGDPDIFAEPNAEQRR